MDSEKALAPMTPQLADRAAATSTGQRPRPRPRSHIGQVACWALGIGLSIYLLSPLLYSQHLEGYTANLQSITLAWERGELATQDVIMPVITDYLFKTRIGIIVLLRAIDSVFGQHGDAAFRGLMIASFALLAACSVGIARQWGRLGLAACLVALLSIPGLVETGSFFNDNLVSAALGIAAMAAVSRISSMPRCILAGALVGAAALCRTDAVLLCPAIAGLVWLRHPRLPPLLARGVAVMAGLLLVFAAVFAFTGVTVLDALAVSGTFVPVDVGIPFHLAIAAFFLGGPAAVLLCIGVALNLRHYLAARDVRWLLVFVVYPACIAGLGVLRLATEVRYIYPLLAPVCLIHVGRGLEWLAGGLSASGRPRRLAAGLTAGLVLLMVLPPVTFVRDGPHSPIGRLWMPLLWYRWQDSVAQSLRQIDRLVAVANNDAQLLVLSTHFNDDFFLKLRLLQDGYRVRAADSVFPDCQGGFSVYEKPGHRVTHVRTDNQYGLAPLESVVVKSLQIQRAMQCKDIWRFDQAYMTYVGQDARERDEALALNLELFAAVLPRLPPAATWSTSFAWNPATILRPARQITATEATPIRLRMGDIHAIEITRAELTTIAASADYLMAEFVGNVCRPEHLDIHHLPPVSSRLEGPRTRQGPFSYDEFVALYRTRP